MSYMKQFKLITAILPKGNVLGGVLADGHGNPGDLLRHPVAGSPFYQPSNRRGRESLVQFVL